MFLKVAALKKGDLKNENCNIKTDTNKEAE